MSFALQLRCWLTRIHEYVSLADTLQGKNDLLRIKEPSIVGFIGFFAPIVFLVLFAGKVLSKIFGLHPVIKRFRDNNKKESWYYTLLMSTGLTFGTISALYGLTHNIVTKEQFSHLVAVVIASAVIPTIIANMMFLPEHLLIRPIAEEEEIVELEK